MSPNDHGYPRPQLRRPRWTSLDGTWDFALDPRSRWMETDAARPGVDA